MLITPEKFAELSRFPGFIDYYIKPAKLSRAAIFQWCDANGYERPQFWGADNPPDQRHPG